MERDVRGGDHSETWVSLEGFDSHEYRVSPDEPWPLDPLKMYSVCFYWSMQTLTTIGYGGTAAPANEAEYLVASFAMMLGSIIWAYLIGKISTLMHFLSRNHLEHHQMMDNLDEFIHEKNINANLAYRLRRYFVKRQSLDKMETYQVLLNHMSPTLRGDVAAALTGPWLHRVSWLRNAERSFVTSLAMLMRPEIYPPMEMISGETFHVVVRGVVIKDMRVLCSGMIWGLDMILTNKSLRRMRPAIALTYVEVLELRRVDLLNLLARFPKARKRVRQAVIWLAFKRKFLAHAREVEMLTSQIGKLLIKEVGSRDRVRENFRKYDTDGDGWINTSEFADSLYDLGFEARSDIIDNLVARFDSNNDGKISLDEFFKFFDTYSKESSRLLHMKSGHALLSIGSAVEHHVVDADHGLNDHDGADALDMNAAVTDDGLPLPRLGSVRAAESPVSRIGSSATVISGGDRPDRVLRDESVHQFTDKDLLVDLHAKVTGSHTKTRQHHAATVDALQKQVDQRFQILNHNMLLIAQKLGIHKDRLWVEVVPDEGKAGARAMAAFAGGNSTSSKNGEAKKNV